MTPGENTFDAWRVRCLHAFRDAGTLWQAAMGRSRPAQGFYLGEAGLLRHQAVIGKSGTGKSEYLLWRLAQQLAIGGGALVIDAKADRDFRDRVWNIAAAFGRADSLRCVDIGDASASHTCNPLLRGDAAAVASRFTDLVDVGDSPAAEHFRSQAHLAIEAVVGAIDSLGLAWCAADLHQLLSQPAALDWLARHSAGTSGGEALARWLAAWRTRGAHGAIDGEALRQQIGGLVARLFMLGSGDLGRVTSTYAPEVDLLDAIDRNLVLHVMLPALEKREATTAFARLLFGELRSVLAALYRRPAGDRPARPFLVLMDEFGSYASRVVAPTFEMARGARVALVPLFQTLANLGTEALAAQVLGNVETVLCLGVADPVTAETAAQLFGQVRRGLASRTRGSTRSSGNRNLALELFHSTSASSTETVSVRETWDYRIRPETFMSLPPGEAFVRMNSREGAWHLRLPRIEPPPGAGFRLQPGGSVGTPHREGIGPRLAARGRP